MTQRQRIFTARQVNCGNPLFPSFLRTHLLSAMVLDVRSFPADPGVYVLVLHLAAPTTIGVGRLGTFDFAAGCYAYVGSACGPGGLRGRLAHHHTPTNNPHWHIDYLRRVAALRGIWYAAAPSDLEHEWAAALLALPGVSVPAPRFGASDCRCRAHLVHAAGRVQPDAIAAWLPSSARLAATGG